MAYLREGFGEMSLKETVILEVLRDDKERGAAVSADL